MSKRKGESTVSWGAPVLLITTSDTYARTVAWWRGSLQFRPTYLPVSLSFFTIRRGWMVWNVCSPASPVVSKPCAADDYGVVHAELCLVTETAVGPWSRTPGA